ncbi:hypothetical protein ACFXHD_11520 [Streptomyces hydrogenans]|uniref:hypothetical protein n=1 Tax=Streptomyces hydrogenans TaxID=1873719 RepID=UPI003697FCD1
MLTRRLGRAAAVLLATATATATAAAPPAAHAEPGGGVCDTSGFLVTVCAEDSSGSRGTTSVGTGTGTGSSGSTSEIRETPFTAWVGEAQALGTS